MVETYGYLKAKAASTMLQNNQSSSVTSGMRYIHMTYVLEMKPFMIEYTGQGCDRRGAQCARKWNFVKKIEIKIVTKQQKTGEHVENQKFNLVSD